MAWWYSEECLRDSAVLLGPKCSYVVMDFGKGRVPRPEGTSTEAP